MNSIRRRTFIQKTGIVAGGYYLGILRNSHPSTILYNGNVITIHPGYPKAEAIALVDDRIFAVGKNQEIQDLAGPYTKKINLYGKTVVPGFNDAHSHPGSAGRKHLTNIDCDLRSIEAIQKAVRERSQQTPKGEWIWGFKYDDTKTVEGRYIHRKDLDEVAPDHPVFISHRGGHTSFVNSMALKLAGIDNSTPDPEGGEYVRDPDTKELTGRILETANSAFYKFSSQPSPQDYIDGVELISLMLAKAGITSVTDAGGSPEDLKAYQLAYREDKLKTRIYCHIRGYFLDQMNEAGISTGFGNHWVKTGAMKAGIDGSISERTARLSEPYIGMEKDYYGILTSTDQELYEICKKAHVSDWQIGIHANGDVGIDKTLNVFERLQKEHPRDDPRFRIEHCTVVNEELIRRIKAIGAIPNPFSTYVYFHGEKMKYYGHERLNRMFAVRSFLDAGIPVTQTSDYPPGPYEPMMALQSMVTRTDYKGTLWGPDQRITPEEAIKVGTLHGAYASFEEDIKGSLETGKLADLVVLDKNPLEIDPFELISINVERTMVGGKWIYES